MRIANREIAILTIPKKMLMMIILVARSVVLFKRPLRLVLHYIMSKPLPEKIVEFRNGHKIHLSSYPHDLTTAMVLFCKHEYGKMPEGGTVVDIGANIGTFTLYAIFNGAAKVYAFEPNLEAYEILLRNIEQNGISHKVFASNLAVTDSDNATVFIPQGSNPNNSIVLDGFNDKNDSTEVKTISLNGIIAINNLASVDLVKMDCEGSEYAIVEAANQECYDKVKQVRFEYHNGTDRLTHHLRQFGFIVDGFFPDNNRVGRIFYAK